MMLRIYNLLCYAVLIVATISFLGLGSEALAQSKPESQVFRIATASKAGTFYPIGSLIAKGITGTKGCIDRTKCGVPGLIAIAQVSNGSVANVEAVSAGRIDAGLAQADVIYWAYTATGRFLGKPPLQGFRAVANLYPGSLHIVTSRHSGIERLEDLRGKRVALDEPGSGTLATAELILASIGILKTDISPLYIKHNHAGPKLAKDELDAFFFVAGYPTGSVVKLSKSTDIRLLTLPSRIIDRLTSQRPYLAAGVIPAGAYRGIEEDVPTVDIGTQLIVRADMDREVVYGITAAMWNERTRRLLDDGHPKGSQVRLETALKGIAIPFHDGAARLYREAGLLEK